MTHEATPVEASSYPEPSREPGRPAARTVGAELTQDAWSGLVAMLGDLSQVLLEDARDARELVEGYRVLTRVVALCAELCVDVDAGAPRFFSMTTDTRQVGGPNPDGEYDLCSLMPGQVYRVRGRRGSSTYLGFQVMAGVGLSPRRQAAYLGDRDLLIEPDGRFEFVLAATAPVSGEQWLPIPEDASAIVVRQYVSDRSSEVLASYEVELVGPQPQVEVASDAAVAEQLVALTWTAFKLMTLHRTVLPGLSSTPNTLVTAEAAALGSENTTPDNLYMLGAFELGADEVLELTIAPPVTRYWSITLKNVWHECLEPRRRRSSATHVGLRPDLDGLVRVAISGRDPDAHNWLDTGGRPRGFVVLRWLDNPHPPEVTTRVITNSKDSRQ